MGGVVVDALRAYGSGGAAPTMVPVVVDERMPPGIVGMMSATDMAVLNLASGSVATLADLPADKRPAGRRWPGAANNPETVAERLEGLGVRPALPRDEPVPPRRSAHALNCKCLVCKPPKS